MKVVLVRKLADVMDGVDLRGYRTGDVVDLPPADAQLLIAEQWVIPDRRLSQTAQSVERRHHQQSASHEAFDRAS